MTEPKTRKFGKGYLQVVAFSDDGPAACSVVLTTDNHELTLDDNGLRSLLRNLRRARDFRAGVRARAVREASK